MKKKSRWLLLLSLALSSSSILIHNLIVEVLRGTGPIILPFYHASAPIGIPAMVGRFIAQRVSFAQQGQKIGDGLCTCQPNATTPPTIAATPPLAKNFNLD